MPLSLSWRHMWKGKPKEIVLKAVLNTKTKAKPFSMYITMM